MKCHLKNKAEITVLGLGFAQEFTSKIVHVFDLYATLAT